MGKKKSARVQNHQSQSFGTLVSKAALTQLKPEISAMVKELGQEISSQTTNTLENIYVRLVVIEQLLMEKFPDITADTFTNKLSDVEDKRDGLEEAEEVANGDVVRVAIRTKFGTQTEFQGSSRNKIYGVGSGGTFGLELESLILGMKKGEVRVGQFGQDKQLTAQITLDRVSRPIPKPTPAAPVEPAKENENVPQV